MPGLTPQALRVRDNFSDSIANYTTSIFRFMHRMVEHSQMEVSRFGACPVRRRRHNAEQLQIL